MSIKTEITNWKRVYLRMVLRIFHLNYCSIKLNDLPSYSQTSDWFSVLIVGRITREYQEVRATSGLHLQRWNELILNKRCSVYKFFHDVVVNSLLQKEASIQKIECVLRANFASQINMVFYFTEILSVAFPISQRLIDADYLFQVHLRVLQALYL